jgi:hypothetical protein
VAVAVAVGLPAVLVVVVLLLVIGQLRCDRPDSPVSFGTLQNFQEIAKNIDCLPVAIPDPRTALHAFECEKRLTSCCVIDVDANIGDDRTRNEVVAVGVSHFGCGETAARTPELELLDQLIPLTMRADVHAFISKPIRTVSANEWATSMIHQERNFERIRVEVSWSPRKHELAGMPLADQSVVLSQAFHDVHDDIRVSPIPPSPSCNLSN